uniref:Uncharacterized protein n=1 Tax=Arundo donax TaxID=35708 RepID=A0A0A9E5U8_ARUDO
MFPEYIGSAASRPVFVTSKTHQGNINPFV